MQATSPALAGFNRNALTRRYIAALTTLALLIIVGQVLIQVLIAQQTTDSRVVNLAGRQSMLSQNISKTALNLEVARSSEQNELRATLTDLVAQWEQAHLGLQYGDAELGLPPNSSTRVGEMFGEVSTYFEAMRSAAACMAQLITDDLCPALDKGTYLNVILASEGSFLRGMDAIVFQMDAEARNRVDTLRVVQIVVAGAMLFVVVTTTFFVFRPAAQRITKIIDDFVQSEARLQATLTELEQRGRDMQIVAEVSTQAATILEVNRLLREVSDLTKERLGLYHAHIYTLTDDSETLLLAAGAGAVGRQMVGEKRSIAYDNPNSIVAAAARSRRAVVANDVRASTAFLPHPLLPDTRAEMAVPLIARGVVLGVLDVQADQISYFNDSIANTVEVLAGQVAVAIANARLYETAERTSRHEHALGSIDRRVQEAHDMDEIMQAAVRELGKALRVPYTAIELDIRTSENGHSAAAATKEDPQ